MAESVQLLPSHGICAGSYSICSRKLVSQRHSMHTHNTNLHLSEVRRRNAEPCTHTHPRAYPSCISALPRSPSFTVVLMRAPLALGRSSSSSTLSPGFSPSSVSKMSP